MPTPQYILSVQPSPQDNRDFRVGAIQTQRIDYPESLDLTPYLLPVRDQGEYGTCSAQVVACIKEYQAWKKYQISGENRVFSPMFVFNFRENQADNSMTPRETMKIVNKTGICREFLYPYGITETPDEIDQKAISDADTFKAIGYAQVNSIEELKKALFTNGCCYIAVPCYNYGEQMWQPNPSANQNTILGGHAMTVVGYNKDGFIIRNSWSTDWGMKGYTIFPYSHWGKQYETWTILDDDTKKEFIDITKLAVESTNNFFKIAFFAAMAYIIFKK